MNQLPTSFTLCNISIKYPKNKIFRAFQNICSIAHIDFMVPVNKPPFCQANVYVNKWIHGILSAKFIELLQTSRFFDFIIHNFYVWRIMPFTIFHYTPNQSECQKIHIAENDSIVIVKIKQKPIPINEYGGEMKYGCEMKYGGEMKYGCEMKYGGEMESTDEDDNGDNDENQ